MEYDKIKQLMEDMGNSKLTSIDIDFADGTKIKMTKQNNQTTKDNYFVEKNNNNQEKIENLQGIVEENFSQKTDYPEKTKEKNNIEELKKLLYERVKEIHVTRFPYNDFLFQKYDEEENI